jgi:signal transduction histidine kinase
MKIRSKLTITFFLLVVVILSLATLSIYFFFADYRESDYFRRLKNRTMNTATLIVEGQLESAELITRFENTNPGHIPPQYIFVFSPELKPIYATKDYPPEIGDPSDLLQRIQEEKEVRVTEGKYQIIGFRFFGKGEQYLVVGAASDTFGQEGLENLEKILLAVFAVSLVFVSIGGWFYAGRFLSPISKVITDVEKITESNLDVRIDHGSGNDEIAKLARTFNNMLGRLEDSFLAQKNFISNASHELRTPIAIISAEIEAALLQTEEGDQNYEVLNSVLENTKSLSHLSTQLLLLAQTSAQNPEQKFPVIRIDDVIWDAKHELEKANPDYTITVDFDLAMDDEAFQVRGDAQLLKVAVINLMDNACKYSDDCQVVVRLAVSSGSFLCVEFVNTGTGIHEEDHEKVFAPFYRGKSSSHTKGYGIGLSLARRIMKLHQGTIGLQSASGSHTTFALFFPTNRIWV